MSTSYDLKALKAPRTSGFALRMTVKMLERGFPGDALANKLLNDVGMNAFRQAPCEEALPPIHPLFSACGVHHSAAENQNISAPDHLKSATDHPYETSQDFVAAYLSGETTPSAVAQRLVEAIGRLEGAETPLGCVVEQRIDDLEKQARASTERYAAGQPLGPLDGVPIGVKDELDLAHYKSRVGTAFMGTTPATGDAFCVGRLRQAGALLFGKLNMHEIGIGVTGINPHNGAARNPHDLNRVTGGSSSGSASAIAAGLCPITVGADGGGSIRIPAALCGVVGLKPTFGRVSEHGAAPLCWSVAHVGPLGASVHDTAIAYGVMAGRDPADPNSLWQPPVGSQDADPNEKRTVRLGVYRPWFEDAQESIVKACDETLAALGKLNVEIVPIELPELGLLRTAHMVTISTEMLCSQRAWMTNHRTDYGCDTRLNLALAERICADDYIRAQRLRGRFFGYFMAALKGIDAIVTPTTGITAPPIHPGAESCGESNLAQLDRIMRFAPAANLTGLPALSVPINFDENGMPIGMQLMGAPWSEHRLLEIGYLIESQVKQQVSAINQGLIRA